MFKRFVESAQIWLDLITFRDPTSSKKIDENSGEVYKNIGEKLFHIVSLNKGRVSIIKVIICSYKGIDMGLGL